MKKLLIISLLFLTSCGGQHKEYKTFEVTFTNGDKEIFSSKHTAYSDGSFHRLTLKDGCMQISHQTVICSVRSFKYIK